MKKIFIRLLTTTLAVVLLVSCKQTNTNTMDIKPPKAPKKETILEKHADKRIDNYFWMNQRDSPEVLAYLEAENKYYEQMTASNDALKNSLFEEMKSRIKEDDSSVPYKYNGYWYITRFEQGKEYPIFSRKKEHLDAQEEIIFDVNEMAKGFAYYKLSNFDVSPDNRYVCFLVDTQGRRMYSMYIKDLQTGTTLTTHIENVTNSVWANDNKTIFYSVQNTQTLRSERIKRHILGTDPKNDVEIYYEKDPTFTTYVSKSKSDKYILINSSSTMSTEYQILLADTPLDNFKIFQQRIRGLEYEISHYGEYFYILNNADNATNFKIDKTPISNTSKEYWTPLIAHREDTLLEDIDIFKDYLVVSERNNGLNKIRIIRWDGTQDEYLPFDNETYTAFVSTNPEFDTDILRYAYASLTTPSSVIDYNMKTKTKEVKKEQQILGGKFDKNNYASERIWAVADDGVKIPISLVYKKGMVKDGNNPLLLYGYGSYGSTVDPAFSSSRLSLLDRGFIFAIAHIRGGEYLGRQWYENGKLLHKKNTFTDFISCGKHLTDEKYTSPQHLYAMGGSAGGLLMGAVINMAPNLFNGVVAQVPFVDVITTMLDDSIPLTTGEYDEWGNPNDKTYYEYMKSYSPYDNISAKKYPNLLVTTGYHDSQVQYWEPAKWVALLRELKTDDNLLLFKTNMDAGHSGASGRFDSLREVAEEYAFLLSLEGINQ